jgi:hypothetical protein
VNRILYALFFCAALSPVYAVVTVKFLDSGTADTQDFSNWAALNGSPSSAATALAATDVRSMHLGSGVNIVSGAGTASANGRVSIYVQFTTRANVTGWFSLKDASGTAFAIGLDANNHLVVNANGSTLIATGTATISASTVYRITIAYTITSTSVYTIKVFIAGVQDISVSNSTALGTAAPDRLSVGAGGTLVMDFSNVYVDDGTTLDDPGDVRVTVKKPAASNTNNFNTLIGSATNRWDYVSERPLSESKGIEHTLTTDVQENFTLQTISAGDADFTGGTVLGYKAWMWAKCGVAETRLVQSFVVGATSAGTTLQITTISGTTVGDTFLIAFCMDGATGTVSCTDNAGTPNTYVVDVDKAAASPGSGNVRTCIFRAYIANVTGLTTITITHPSVAVRTAVITEFAGILQTSPLDKSASAVTASTTAASSGATAATTQADEVIFGAIGYEDNTAVTNTTGSSPAMTYISEEHTTGGGAASNNGVTAQYVLQTATGAHTAAATLGASTDAASCVACYKCTNAGSITLGTPKIMVNGSESAITLDTTSQLFSSYTTSSSYPSNAAAIGIRSTNATPDTYLYECGIDVAIIPGVGGGSTVPPLAMHYVRSRNL